MTKSKKFAHVARQVSKQSLFIVGAGALTFGAYELAPPAGYIVAGAITIATALGMR